MEYFLIYLLKSCGLIIVFWLCFKLFLKQETFFEKHRIFLVSGILISILLPLWVLKKIIFVEPPPFSALNLPLPIPSEIIAVNLLRWVEILLIIYIIGVFTLALRFIIQLLSLNKLLQKCSTQKDGKYTIAITNDRLSPFSFFNTIVYNPTMYDKKAVEAIIIHEKIHANQKHSIDIILVHLLTIFQWFNPIAWLYKKEISQNLEYIADKNSTELLEDKKAYQYLLLHQSGQSGSKTTIINPFFNSLIKKRIVMLNQQKSKQINLVKFSLILPLLAAFMFLFNTKTIAQVKEATTQKSQWVVGYGVSTNATELIIDKNSTDNELEVNSNTIKENTNIDLIFSKIKRNNKGEIIAIKSTYKTNYGSGSYNVSSDEPIDAFIFSITMNEDGAHQIIGYQRASSNDRAISVFSGSNKNSNSKNSVVTITNTKKEIINSNQSNNTDSIINSIDPRTIKRINVTRNEEDENGKIEIMVTDENDSITTIKQIDAPTQTIQIRGSGTSSQNLAPIYVIDGIVQEEDFNQSSLDIDTISKMNIIKGSGATKKYGRKAENGVIEVTTKQDKFKIQKTVNTKNASENPLYIVDGKEKNTISNLDNNKIKSTNVLTGESATKKYGEKGKNGVVEITMKNN